MRAFTVIFSSWAFVLLIVLGAVFNLISWPTPYNFPTRVVGTLLGEAPGLIFALVALGYGLYDAAQRNAARWFIALLIWPIIPLLAFSLTLAGALSYTLYWFAPLALIPLAPFIYGLLAAPLGPRPAPLAPTPHRYGAFVGILTAVTVALGVILINPFNPPLLQGSPQQTQVNCVKGLYPDITLANGSQQTIYWTAKTQDVNVIPSSGSLAPNSTMQVAIEGRTNLSQVNIQFTPNLGTGFTATFICQ
jgi:hypothetical protein